MNTIGKDVIVEQEITKSSFITYLKKVTSVEEAKSYIKEIKELHPSATHHVTSYLVGPTGEHGHANDDGEPSGTAGLPILNILKKKELDCILAVVIRYFGGIKLGAGGLVRAYSKSVRDAVIASDLVDAVKGYRMNVIISYDMQKNLDYLLKN